MNRKIIAPLLVVIIIAGISITILLGNQEETIDSRIHSLMEEGNIPSLAAGIIVNDTMVWSKGYGEQSDINTVYMIGSVTKMFTSTAIMQLVENDKLDLDADINTYIPFSLRNPNNPNTPITIRMLLTHRSGINRDTSSAILWTLDTEALTWANNNLGTNFTIWETRPTLEEFLEGSLIPSGQYYDPVNWASQPDLTFTREYSNTGYLLLSYIVEQVTDQTFTEYLNENILTPLNMTSTGYDHNEFSNRNAIPYELRLNNNFAYPIYNSYYFGAGGLRSTVPDLGNFLIAHMNQGCYQNTFILQPDTVDYMQTSQYQNSSYGSGGAWTLIGWNGGLPLNWPPDKNQTNFGHGGAAPGYRAQIAFQTVGNSKYGIVFLTNRGDSFVGDSYLIHTFLPNLSELLFEEA